MCRFSSYAEASTAVERLVELGVTDYYVIPNGNYSNAVSLGLYEQESIARQRQADIESFGEGWSVSVEMHRENEARYWLDFETRGESDINWEMLLADTEAAQRLEVQCDANETSFPPT